MPKLNHVGAKCKVKMKDGTKFDFHLEKYNDYKYVLKRTGYSTAGYIDWDDVNDASILREVNNWADGKPVSVIW